MYCLLSFARLPESVFASPRVKPTPCTVCCGISVHGIFLGSTYCAAHTRDWGGFGVGKSMEQCGMTDKLAADTVRQHLPFVLVCFFFALFCILCMV